MAQTVVGTTYRSPMSSNDVTGLRLVTLNLAGLRGKEGLVISLREHNEAHIVGLCKTSERLQDGDRHMGSTEQLVLPTPRNR